MDLWVVAAAAGAGYIAKNLPNFSVDKKESIAGPSFKYSYNLQSESKNFLQQLRDKTCPLRRLAQKTLQDDIFPDLENHSEASVASISGDYTQKVGILEDYNKGWNSSLSSEGFGAGESQQFGDGESITLSRINGGKLVRSKRCQVHSSMSAFRPVLVTDAKWEETKMEDNASSPSWRKSQSSEELKKSEKSYRSSQGVETVLLFITGMTIGIMTATTSWKSEVDQLNRQLEQMQSLVLDLHVELERDKGEDTPVEPVSSPSADALNKSDGVKADDKNAENLELLSRIEAELQAELEMLEQNMKASELQRIVTGGVELDEDFVPEIVKGDLKPAMMEEASESESRTTDTAGDYSKPANYAVSPQELTLRLHDLIESRLETRIKELENALSHSENRVEVLHSVVSGRRFSYSETESSSTHHSPACICDEHEKREDKPSTKSYDESGSKFADPGTRSINNGYDSISQSGLDQDVPQTWDEQRLMGLMINEDSMSEDEGSDESEMLFIKQIIQRRKSGSNFYFQID